MSEATHPEAHAQSLDTWLEIATRGLCPVARVRVVAEIASHVQSAAEEGARKGLHSEDARSTAMSALGDPNEARVTLAREHLTQREIDLLSRLSLLSPRRMAAHAGIRCVLFGIASWMFIVLCMAEYFTVSGHAGRLTAQEALFIIPWILWLAYWLAAQLRGKEEKDGWNGNSLRAQILCFYWLMGASATALFASSNGWLRATGATCLILVAAFSLSRVPLAMKLGRVNQNEITLGRRRRRLSAIRKACLSLLCAAFSREHALPTRRVRTLGPPFAASSRRADVEPRPPGLLVHDSAAALKRRLTAGSRSRGENDDDV